MRRSKRGSRLHRRRQAVIFLPVVAIVMALLGGSVFGGWDKIENVLASHKELPKANCMQDWTGVHDQNDSVKSLQLRRCDEASGIR